jgi:hypothetical protein
MRTSPRRYYVDDKGRRVLVGLTMEETLEFEQLDRLGPLDRSGVDDAGNFDETAFVSLEKRWLELYAKHDGAWKSWMVESKHRRI